MDMKNEEIAQIATLFKHQLIDHLVLCTEDVVPVLFCVRLTVLVEQDHQRWEYSTVERFAKKLNKDKRKEQRNNYILIWGGSSSVSIFFTSAFAPSALRSCVCRICR